MTTEERRSKNKEIKAFHQSTLDALGVPNAIVMSKMAYKPTGLSEKHIAFFDSELNKDEDIYIEFGNIDLIAEKVDDYPLKSLLKYRRNPNYKEEYSTSDPGLTNTRYFVPISELIIVKKSELKNLSTKWKGPILSFDNRIETEVLESIFEERESKISELLCQPFDVTTDPLVKDLTIRDYAAIHMRKPISNKKWLNELILKELTNN